MIDTIYGCAKAIAMGCVWIYGVIRLREEIAKRKAENYCVRCTRCKAIDGDGKVYCRLEGKLDKQPRYCRLHTTEPEPRYEEEFSCGRCYYATDMIDYTVYCVKRKARVPDRRGSCLSYKPIFRDTYRAEDETYLGEQCKYGWQSATGIIWCEKRKRQCCCECVCCDFEPKGMNAMQDLQKSVHEMINEANNDKGIRYEQF